MEKTHYNKQDDDTERADALTLFTIEDGISQAEPSQAESQSQSISNEPTPSSFYIEPQINPQIEISIQAIEPQRATEPSQEPQSHPEPSQSQKPSQEPQESKTEPLQTEPQSQKPIDTTSIQHISILPSIREIERFIAFLNTEFKIEPPKNLIVLIQKTDAFVKGYYSPNSWYAFKHQMNSNLNFSVMEFEEFDKLVKTYYPLNKEKSRYLILFNDGYSVFYAYDKKNKTLKRESTRVF